MLVSVWSVASPESQQEDAQDCAHEIHTGVEGRRGPEREEGLQALDAEAESRRHGDGGPGRDVRTDEEGRQDGVADQMGAEQERGARPRRWPRERRYGGNRRHSHEDRPDGGRAESARAA